MAVCVFSLPYNRGNRLKRGLVQFVVRYSFGKQVETGISD